MPESTPAASSDTLMPDAIRVFEALIEREPVTADQDHEESLRALLAARHSDRISLRGHQALRAGDVLTLVREYANGEELDIVHFSSVRRGIHDLCLGPSYGDAACIHDWLLAEAEEDCQQLMARYGVEDIDDLAACLAPAVAAIHHLSDGDPNYVFRA